MALSPDVIADLNQIFTPKDSPVGGAAKSLGLGDLLNNLTNSPQVLVFASTAGTGGSATQAMTVTGLLSTDTILSVTQKTQGANSLPLIGWSTQVNNGVTAIWSADPGAGSVIQVAVRR